MVSIQLSLLCRESFFILRICGKICISIKKRIESYEIIIEVF